MMLFALDPDENDSNLMEPRKVCQNAGHFLNAYLCVNKGGHKQTKPGNPSPVNSRGLQRSAVILMSGILFSAFRKAKPSEEVAKLNKYVGAKVILNAIINANNENTLMGLGYDICIRNWISVNNNGKLHPCKTLIKRGQQKLSTLDGILVSQQEMGERLDSIDKYNVETLESSRLTYAKLEKRMRTMESKFKVAQESTKNDAQGFDSRMEYLDEYSTESFKNMESRIEHLESLFQGNNDENDTLAEGNNGEVDNEGNGTAAEGNRDEDEDEDDMEKQDNAADGKAVEDEGMGSDSQDDQDENEEDAQDEYVPSDGQGDPDDVDEDANATEDKESDNAAAEKVGTNDEDEDVDDAGVSKDN